MVEASGYLDTLGGGSRDLAQGHHWLVAGVSANCPVGQLHVSIPLDWLSRWEIPQTWFHGPPGKMPQAILFLPTHPISAYTSGNQLHRLFLTWRKLSHLFVNTVGPTLIISEQSAFEFTGHAIASSIYIPTKSQDIPVIFIYLVSKSHGVHDG